PKTCTRLDRIGSRSFEPRPRIESRLPKHSSNRSRESWPCLAKGSTPWHSRATLRLFASSPTLPPRSKLITLSCSRPIFYQGKDSEVGLVSSERGSPAETNISVRPAELTTSRRKPRRLSSAP